jgi:hypothetical protein
MLFEILILVLEAILGYWIAGIVHEMGHVVAGIAFGWKFQWIVVGCFGLKRNGEGHIQPYFERNPLLWGGVGAALPTDSSGENDKAWAFVLLCGPLASLALAIVALPLGIVLNVTFLFVLGAMSIGIGVACLLPVSTGILYTDGKRFARLRGNIQEKTEETALFKIAMYKIFEENRFALNTDDIEALKAAKLPAIQYYGHYNAYLFNKNRNDINNMNTERDAMNKIAAKTPKMIRDECVVE